MGNERKLGFIGDISETAIFTIVSSGRGSVEEFDRLDPGGELFAVFGERPEIALDLDAVPEGVGLAEEGTEADGHGRGDGAFAVDDLVDRPGRDADGVGFTGLELSTLRSRVDHPFQRWRCLCHWHPGRKFELPLATRKKDRNSVPPDR